MRGNKSSKAPFNRLPEKTVQIKPGVAQMKTGVSSVKHPVAPPVYRPHPVPKVLQTKSSPSQRPINRVHVPAVRASASRVVQRAEDQWEKYDDVWWPKAYRVNGPYKSEDLWATWGAVNRYKGFTAHQIQLLIAANKKRNGGVLRSDANNDPHPVLAETTGQLDSVECDHVIGCKLKGGANHWWNARLISRELNNSLEREVDHARK